MLELWYGKNWSGQTRLQRGKFPYTVHIGSSVTYPLAQVKIAIGDSSYEVEAAISDQLPVPVVLDRDVPEFLEMLQKPHYVRSG